MSTPRIALAAAAATLLVGCAEATGPDRFCPGCEVAGVDLVVGAPAVAWDPADIDALTGLPVAGPGDTLAVTWAVRNRGNERSRPTTLLLCINDLGGACRWADRAATVAVPAIAAGDSVGGEAEFVVPALRYLERFVLVAGQDWRAAEDEPLYANDAAASDSILARVPRLTGEIEVPDSVRIGREFRIPVRITNASRLAASPATTMYVCFDHYDVICDPPFSPVPIPALAPGESWTDTVTAVAPREAFWGSYTGFWEFWLAVCPGWDDPAYDLFGVRCIWVPHDPIPVFPNYEAECGATPIRPDTVLAGRNDPADCDILPISSDADAWSLDLAAGETVTATLTSSSGATPKTWLFDYRGEAPPQARDVGSVTLSASVAGRYYLFVGGAGEYELAVRRTGG